MENNISNQIKWNVYFFLVACLLNIKHSDSSLLFPNVTHYLQSNFTDISE